jgi:hypothetical protein
MGRVDAPSAKCGLKHLDDILMPVLSEDEYRLLLDHVFDKYIRDRFYQSRACRISWISASSHLADGTSPASLAFRVRPLLCQKYESMCFQLDREREREK